MDAHSRPVALVTGGSRGIGAETALALAARGYDVVITYRNKAARANEVLAAMKQRGADALSLACDITHSEDIARLFATLKSWRGFLNVLVLNAAGGLERDLVAADPNYPMRINHDAQLALLDAALPLLSNGSLVMYVTSHWAHLHGQVDYIPAYAPVASTKHAGEMALRARQPVLSERGIRLVVVTGDLIEDTIMAKMMERLAPGISEERRELKGGELPSAREMGQAIAEAAVDQSLPSGHTVVVGGALDSFQRKA